MISKKQTKFIKSLKIKKYRAKEKCFLVEGQKNVGELINSDYHIRAICGTADYFRSNNAILEPVSSLLHQVTPNELQDLGTFKINNDCLAVAEIKTFSLQDLNTNEHVVALDGVSDPGNLGTIIRTMDWFGFRQLICANGTAEFYSPKVVNSTMGSFTRVTCVYGDLVAFIRESGMPAFGADLQGQSLTTWKPDRPVILVMGSESHGLSASVIPYLAGKVSIMKYGEAESLNVAIATGIMCHHLRS